MVWGHSLCHLGAPDIQIDQCFGMSPSPTIIRKKKPSLKASMLSLPLQYLSANSGTESRWESAMGCIKGVWSTAMAENHICPINGLILHSQTSECPVSQITSQSVSASLGWCWPGLVGIDEWRPRSLSSSDFLAWCCSEKTHRPEISCKKQIRPRVLKSWKQGERTGGKVGGQGLTKEMDLEQVPFERKLLDWALQLRRREKPLD